MNTAFGMVKINLKFSKTAYLTAGIIFAMAAVNYILALTVNEPGNTSVALGNYLYFLPPLLAIFIPAQNFSKLMSPGGKRTDFFNSSILTYSLITVIAAALSIVSNLTLDHLMVKKVGLVDLLNVFGFMKRGSIIAFFQTSALLLLICCVTHTLTLIQGRWYGWVVDAILIAIISVFIPIAPLRAILVSFFNLIIFHNVAIVQIVSCLILGGIIYYASLIPIKSKQI